MAVFQERTNSNGVTASYWRLSLANINIQGPGQIRVLWYGYKDADHRSKGASNIDYIWEEHSLTDDQLALLYDIFQPISPNFAGAVPIIEEEAPEPVTSENDV